MAAHSNAETFTNSWNSPVTSTVSSLPYAATSGHYPHPYPDMSKYYNSHIAGGKHLHFLYFSWLSWEALEDHVLIYK